ncbi:hypothetical protein MMPV_001575 [Pyropia vietnamensis]
MAGDPAGDPGGCRWAPPPSPAGVEPPRPPPAWAPTVGVYATHVRVPLPGLPDGAVAALQRRLPPPPLANNRPSGGSMCRGNGNRGGDGGAAVAAASDGWTFIPPPHHVSLSHTHALPAAARSAAIAAIAAAVARVPPFTLSWTALPVVLFGGGRWWGGGMLVDTPRGGFTAAVRAVDRGLAVVGGGAYYVEPLPHASVAWAACPTGGSDAEVAAAAAAEAAAAALAEEVPPTTSPITWEVRSVVAVIGKRPHVLPLGGDRR